MNLREPPVAEIGARELVVDGEIVELNRVPVPADRPIIDEWFQNGAGKRSGRVGGGQTS